MNVNVRHSGGVGKERMFEGKPWGLIWTFLNETAELSVMQ